MKKLFFFFAIVLSVSFQLNAQWTEQTSGVTTALQSISAVDNNVAWICGNGGVVLRTVNGGTTWQSKTGAPVTGDLVNIFAWDSLNALCTSSPGATLVYRTTDGGATWAQVFTQTGGFIDAIWMFSATDGIMYGDPVGSRWSLWKTSDGGATWDSTGLFLPQAGSEAGWNNAMYVNGSNIYFGTSNSRVYYSTNSGTNWISQAMTLTNTFGIWFNSPTRGIASGSTQGLVSTTNSGTNWNALTSLATGTIYAVTGYQNVWYHTRGTRLFGSNDDGATWDTVYIAAAGTFYNLSKARNGDVVWACRSNGGITKGTNVQIPVELTSFTASTSNGSVTLQWRTATETNNKIFEIEKKSDNSDYAKIGFVNGQGTTTQAHDYVFVDNSVIPGSYIYRLKQIDYDGHYSYSSEAEVEIIAPTVFQLSQNYPNPFNPSTTIKYSLAQAGNVRLAVYNTLGQEVTTLVNEFKESGNFQISFDAVKLSSGVYFYKLEAPNFVQIKKMIVNK